MNKSIPLFVGIYIRHQNTSTQRKIEAHTSIQFTQYKKNKI